jgi:hypothetical protein
LDPMVWFFRQIFVTWWQKKKGWQIQRRAFLKFQKKIARSLGGKELEVVRFRQLRHSFLLLTSMVSIGERVGAGVGESTIGTQLWPCLLLLASCKRAKCGKVMLTGYPMMSLLAERRGGGPFVHHKLWCN